MLLNKLTLRNFKRYADEEITFHDGITGITGNNGAGKSTIVEGILFALYGVKGTGIDGDFVLSSGAASGEKCEVTLSFSVAGDPYTIIRWYRKGKKSTQHDAQIILEGGDKPTLLADGVTAVEKEVQRILGMGPADFRNTIYAGQKDLLTLLDETPGERQRWFMRMLGIDYLKKEGEAAIKEEERALERQSGALEVLLEKEDSENVRTLLREEDEKLRATRARRDASCREETALKGEEEELKTGLERLREIRERYLSLREKCLSYEHEHERNIADLARFRERREALAEVEKQVETLRGAEEAFSGIKADFEAISAGRSEYERFAATLRESEQRSAYLRQERGRLEKELKSLSEDEKLLRKLRPVITHRNELLQKRSRLTEARVTYQEMLDEKSRAEEHYAGFEDRVHGLVTEIQRLEPLQEDIKGLRKATQGSGNVREKEGLYEEAGRHASQITALRNEAKRAEIDQISVRDAISGYRQEMTEAGNLEDEIRTLESQKEALGAAAGRGEERIRNLINDQEKARTQLREIMDAGKKGICPTCHRSLGEHYQSITQEIREQISGFETEMASLKKSLTETSEQREELENREPFLREKRAELQRVVGRIHGAEAELEKSEKRLSELKSEIKKEVEAIRALGLDGYDPKAHSALRDEVKRLEEAAKRLSQLQGETAHLPDLLLERGRLIEETGKCLSAQNAIEEKIQASEYSPEGAERLEGEIRSLEHAWLDYHSAQKHLEIKQEKEQEAAMAESRLTEETEKSRALSEAIETLGYDPDEYTCFQTSFRDASEAHEEYLRLSARLGEIPETERAISTEERAAGEHKAALESLHNEVSGLCYDHDAIPETETRLTALRERSMLLVREISESGAEETAISGRINQLNDHLTTIQEYTERLRNLQDELALLRQTRRLIGGYVTYLLNVVRDQIEGEVGRVLGEITDGRYENVLINEGFSVLINDMGENFPASRFSGGEQDDIAIALRIALSRYLAEMHGINDSTVLIFDEIFGSQDEERRGNLLSALRTQEAHFPQIFLISHISEVQGEFSNTLSVEMGDDGISHVREVSE